jgi:hypothetical protein
MEPLSEDQKRHVRHTFVADWFRRYRDGADRPEHAQEAADEFMARLSPPEYEEGTIVRIRVDDRYDYFAVMRNGVWCDEDGDAYSKDTRENCVVTEVIRRPGEKAVKVGPLVTKLRSADRRLSTYGYVNEDQARAAIREVITELEGEGNE